MSEFKTRVTYNFRLDYDDLFKLNQYYGNNNYPVSMAARWGVKEFIRRFIEGNEIPPKEIINPGNAGKGRPKKHRDDEF